MKGAHRRALVNALGTLREVPKGLYVTYIIGVRSESREWEPMRSGDGLRHKWSLAVPERRGGGIGPQRR